MADEIEQPDEPEVEPAPEAEPLPTHKDDLVALAIGRNVPSYEAWALTVSELTDLLKES